jgi:formylglycine-generating enzyme required for sulfatase activity
MKKIYTAPFFVAIAFIWACGSEVAQKEKVNIDSIPQVTNKSNATSNQVVPLNSEAKDTLFHTKVDGQIESQISVNQQDNVQKLDSVQIKSNADSQVSEATGKPKKDLVPIIPEMIKVVGGTFKMGSKDTDAREDETNIHEVKVSDFYIGKFEITVAQFKSFVEISGYQTEAERVGKSYIYTGSWKNMKGINWRHDARGNMRPASEYDHPVVHVSWNDATAYCKWISEQTKKPFRLLTEAEWEFAARGGTQNKNTKYSGSNNIDEIAWYITSSADKGTFPVGTKKPNQLGIHDLSGNVYEWCGDWYDSEFYMNSPMDNPKGVPSGISRVVRGGSWHDAAEKNRLASRFNGSPTYCGYNIGFRVARSQ